MKRIVIDTNIAVSAFFWGGYPRIVYDLGRTGKVVLLSSFKMEAEFIRVLAYPKFGLKSNEILPLINDLRRNCCFVEIGSEIDIVKEDVTDNMFIECALDGKADYIVSGDSHLLNLGSYGDIQIVRGKLFSFTP